MITREILAKGILSKSHWVYRKHHLEDKLSPEYFSETSRELCAAFASQGTECQTLF